MEVFVVDRFEGDYAICEDSKRAIKRMKREILPRETKEGDCIRYVKEKYVIDEEETRNRKNKVKILMDSLFEK